MNLPKVAIIISHPIQHFCPQFVSYAAIIEYKTKVFFASSAGVKTYKDPTFKKEIQWANLNLDQFDHEFLNDGKVAIINKQLDAKNLENRLSSFAPDAVLIFGYSQKLQRRAYNWARKNSKKIIYFADSELRHERAWYKMLIKRFLLHKYFKNIDAFLTIGDANEAYYRYYNVPDYKMLRSAYPIDVKTFEAAYSNKKRMNEELRNQFSIAENDFVISVVGKFVPWKRQIDIIRAIALLEKDFQNIRLLMIGTGEMENAWQIEANKIKYNKIIFTGFVNPVDLPKYYAASDLYVHPAEIEPHSVAISEAIYMGCSILISDKCGSYGPNDDVQNGYNGFVFKCGDTSDLAQKIKQLLLNKELNDYFGMNSRKYALNAQYLAHQVGLRKALIFTELIK